MCISWTFPEGLSIDTAFVCASLHLQQSEQMGMVVISEQDGDGKMLLCHKLLPEGAYQVQGKMDVDDHLYMQLYVVS